MRSCGIVGLPNVGKSTLFKVLSENFEVSSENYPFCTISPNTGIAVYKDDRLDLLSDIFNSKKKVYQIVKFVDIAGLVEGASEGNGLGNRFLGAIRGVKAILHVVRCFEDDDIVHVCGNVDPIRDIDITDNELTLADLQVIENLIAKIKKTANHNDDNKKKLRALEKLNRYLMDTGNFSESHFEESELDIIKSFDFLKLKPVIYLANVSEDNINNDEYKRSIETLIKSHKGEDAAVIFVSSKIELDLALMEEEERAEMLKILEINGSCINNVISKSMNALGYQTFFTVGPKEAHAWNIKKGETALDAAAEIHTDIAERFVKAEVVSYEDMIGSGSISEARKKGVLRAEGAKYKVNDGDIINILASN